MMRLDPDLCFLSRCGPPDSSEIQEELKHSIDQDENSKFEEDEDRLVVELFSLALPLSAFSFPRSSA